MSRKKRRYDQNSVDQAMGLICPECGGDRFFVVTTRRVKDSIIRYRECRSCMATLATEEKIRRKPPT